MNWHDKDRCNWCSVCGVRGMLPFNDCWFCTDTPSWHHGRCCPGKMSGYCAHFKSPHRGRTDAFVRELDGASREQRGTPDIYGLSQTSESIASSGPTSRSKAPPVVSSCGFAVSCVRPIFGVSSPSYEIKPLLAAPAPAHNDFFLQRPSHWPPAGAARGSDAELWELHRGGTDAFVRELDGASREQRGTPDIYGLSQTSESIASSGPTSRSKSPPVVSSCGFAVSCVRPIFGVSSPSYEIKPLLAAPAPAHNDFVLQRLSHWPPAGAARGSDAELWELREERASTFGQFARVTMHGYIPHVSTGPLVAAPPQHRSYWVVLRAVPEIADFGQLVGPYSDIAGYVERADGIVVPSVVFQGFATAREAQAYWTGAGLPIPVRNVLPLRLS